jgi:CDP-paratose 2-epimerase
MKRTRQTTKRAQAPQPRLAGDAGKPVGLVAHVPQGARGRVVEVLDDLERLGMGQLRLEIGPDWESDQGLEWYEWMLPALAGGTELLPCLPRWGMPAPDYAATAQRFIERFGGLFEHMELPYTYEAPPELSGLADALRRVTELNKRCILGGLRAHEHEHVGRLHEEGQLQHVHALGLQLLTGSHATEAAAWAGLAALQTALGAKGPELWLTSVGYPVAYHDDRRQLQRFLQAIDAPVARLYWCCARDLDREEPQPAYPEEALDTGLRRGNGRPRLLHRLLTDGGLQQVRDVLHLAERPVPVRSRSEVTLVTGGAGFIGSNLADHLLRAGQSVIIYDNLARPGVEHNLAWLFGRHREGLELQLADVRDRATLRRAVRRAGQVFHLGAQTAVTTSLADPLEDHDVNTLGTLFLLEELRQAEHRPPLVFISTNKVYGGLGELRLKAEHTRYEPEDRSIRHYGVAETQSLDLRTPYGCSKGAADQYVLDYARTHDLPATVLRMSCVYGPHQLGTEDQGWVAHFMLRALEGETITVYGDGLQVRDILYVEDLVAALLQARSHIEDLAGHAYNLGGGPGNTVSLVELLDLIETIIGHSPDVRMADWRPGDQRYYVSDISRFAAATGWSPQYGVGEGVHLLYEWLMARSDSGQGTAMPGTMAL